MTAYSVNNLRQSFDAGNQMIKAIQKSNSLFDCATLKLTKISFAMHVTTIETTSQT